jgi:pimeloyl-ACP methyl ester carboxylesterase
MVDVVVVIPGITGSVLARNGDVWALSGSAFASGLFSLGRSLQHLKLPGGIGDDEPDDGVVATGLMPDLHVLPRAWSPIKGYSGLMKDLRDQLGLTEPTEGIPGNLIAFPYDWRLSNVVSGRRLQETVVPALERWRKHTENPAAKLVLICHSMGGLVARWFLEVLGGWELTRWLVTVGTPYQGAVNALEALAEEEVTKGWGPFRVDLTELVRSLPSIYQLLPTYPCVDVGEGSLRSLADAQVPHLATDMLQGAARFHRAIAEKVRQRPADAYRILAIKGIRQPTAQSVRVRADGIDIVRAYGGEDKGGDGTVPRPSAHPPEWADEYGGRTVAAAQRHATLQETQEVFTQLFAVLTTGTKGAWMGGEQVGMDVPDLLPAGEPLVVEVSSEQSNLALTASVSPLDAEQPAAEPQLLAPLGEGRYRVQFEALPPGTYQTTVASAVPSRPVDPVSDVTIVWQPSAE